jgi:phage terminase large subunit
MSGNPYFDNQKIYRQLQAAPEPVKRGRFVYGEDEGLRPVDWEWQDAEDGEITLYSLPEERVPYVIGGDTAGEGSDHFTAHGLDNRTGDQVAELDYQGSSEPWYAQQLYCLGMYFNQALLAPEINFSSYPERKLEEWQYPRLFIREKPDDVRRELDEKKFGWRTDMRTRPLILSNLHSIVDHTPDMLASRALLQQMLVFIRNKDMRPEAAPDEHDDLVMAAAIAHFIRPQQSYEAAEEQEEQAVKLIDRLDPRHRHRR